VQGQGQAAAAVAVAVAVLPADPLLHYLLMLLLLRFPTKTAVHLLRSWMMHC
jgi:hypothetical protein